MNIDGINNIKPLLELDKLEIGYRKGKRTQRLSGKISCNIGRGELISLMGRNGSGKSTLLRTIAGLHDPLGGNIEIEGRTLADYGRTELAKMMGFVSTEVVRVQGLKVRSLVAMGRFPHTGWFGSMTDDDRVKIDEAIELTSLSVLAERDLDELSDGERQRAMIARTLAQDTEVLVLDEPTAFLDIAHRHELTLLLGRLAREQGKAILFSSHDLQLCMKEADRIWLLGEDGITSGTPADLSRDGSLEAILLGKNAIKGMDLD